MLKSLGILMCGIFIGAVGSEIIYKKYPNAVDDMYAKTRKMTSGMKHAFKNGYENAMSSREAAESSA
ncbi:MAG: hypothetical protein ACYSWW_05315 [Planctomycetota bacterium]|jgi:hypothetical protein